MGMEDKYTNYPKSVEESNKELEKMFEAQKKARESQPPIEGAPVEEPIESPVEEPIELPVETPAEKPPEMVSKADLEKSEQRYKTLEGKYNTETGEFRRQNAFLYQTIQNLQQEVEGLKKSKPEDGKPKKFSLRENPKMQALKSELAPEVFENLTGAMEETLEAERKAFEEENAKLWGEFSTTIVKNRDEIFWDAVNAAHKDYNQIANNPKFQEFLSQPEGLSGFTRGDFFINAWNKRDSRTYINYLNAFKKENESPPVEKSEIDPNNPKVKNRIAAPKPSGPSNPNPPAQSPFPEYGKMTKEEATLEYDKIGNEFGKGRWEGREKEYDKREAALIRIINSG
jgi:hypothetical protein